MSLDERLRVDLQRAAESDRLREDDALDHVRMTHQRELVRTRVLRQATAAAVVLSLFAAVAIFVSWRSLPDRYRSTATVRVAVAAGSTTGSRSLKLADPRKLALAASTRRAALLAAHLAPADTRVDFRATLNPSRDLLSLEATAPSANESAMVTRRWVSALAGARRADAVRRFRARNLALERRVTALHDQLIRVDTELAKLDPAAYRNTLRYDAPNGVGRYPDAPPPVPEQASVRELNLVNERIQLLTELRRAGSEAASTRISAVTDPFVSQLVSQTSAARIDETPAVTVPVLTAWGIGLVLVLTGALLAYRRRTRAMRQVSAYSR